MDMPKNVDIAINLLQSAGFEAYAVGGCVRDSLLGKTPNDWDITTSAKPEDMKSVFADFHCIDTGIKHGTVTVVIDGEPLEITTFRLDGEYEDNRHPKSVTFTSDLGADLGRRDFTVNAMAYSKMTGTIDLFGGQNDLKNGIIRCVGNPDRRFNEDALRILRALRFASALDFEIEEKTAQSLLKNRALLGNISEERIAKELLKLVCGKGAKRILTDFAPVLFEILPELQPMYKNSHDNPHHCYDIYEHTLIAVESIDPEPTLRFAMLLHDCGKPAVKKFDENGVAHFYGHQRISAEISAQILARLKVSNKFRDEILFLVSNHDRWELYENTEKMPRYLSKFGLDGVLNLLKVMRADVLAQSPEYRYRLDQIADAEETAKNLAAQKPCLSLSELQINGRTLMDIGIPQGRKLGAVLAQLLDEVIDGVTKNTQEALTTRAREIYSEMK
ncbi:MAG TPA: tRNA nucleotidyltransferase [Ruminococcaceae bacterium]|nr:tRNA nucleotidyltransferase [Oscillospiraceae bacterium]HBW71780.1 tRNA nucleotidyltransferase [Oscillospiraceae bacterium]